MHHVTLIPGDGTGPELAEATRKCVDATGVKINWDRQECGIEVIEAQGKIPDSVFTSIRANKVALKAPITTPIGKGFRSVNVALRQELGLYACVRPCKTYKGVRSYFEKTKVDLIIVRENTEDLYAGVEFQAGQPKTAELIQFINSIATGKKIGTGLETTGVSIKPMSVEGCRNISRYAFDYAVKYGRKSVTSICKANIMKFTDGLWYDTSRAVATAYGAKYEDPKLAEGVKADPTLAGKVPSAAGINYIERLVDNMCMQLVQKPENYDVLVMGNLYGDILSDLCRSRRWPGSRSRCEHRPEFCDLRGDSRLGSEVQRPEQGQPDRFDPLRQADAGTPWRIRRRREARTSRRQHHRGRQVRHLRHEARPQRPHRRRHPRNGRCDLQTDGGTGVVALQKQLQRIVKGTKQSQRTHALRSFLSFASLC